MKYIEKVIVTLLLTVELFRVSCYFSSNIFKECSAWRCEGCGAGAVNAAATYLAAESIAFIIFGLLTVLCYIVVKRCLYNRLNDSFFSASRLFALFHFLLLTVPAYVIGKWLMFELALRRCQLGGLSNAIGLSSGWSGVGVLWGCCGVLFWGIVQFITRWKRVNPVTRLSQVAMCAVLLNILSLSPENLFKTPLEMRAPYHLYDMINEKYSSNHSIDWFIVADTTNCLELCSNPIETICFGRPPVIKRIGYSFGGNLRTSDSEHYYRTADSTEFIVKELMYVSGLRSYSYYYNDTNGKQHFMSSSEAMECIKFWRQ